MQLHETTEKLNSNERINEEDYEFEADETPEEDLVKNLD